MNLKRFLILTLCIFLLMGCQKKPYKHDIIVASDDKIASLALMRIEEYSDENTNNFSYIPFASDEEMLASDAFITDSINALDLLAKDDSFKIVAICSFDNTQIVSLANNIVTIFDIKGTLYKPTNLTSIANLQYLVNLYNITDSVQLEETDEFQLSLDSFSTISMSELAIKQYEGLSYNFIRSLHDLWINGTPNSLPVNLVLLVKNNLIKDENTYQNLMTNIQNSYNYTMSHVEEVSKLAFQKGYVSNPYYTFLEITYSSMVFLDGYIFSEALTNYYKELEKLNLDFINEFKESYILKNRQ